MKTFKTSSIVSVAMIVCLSLASFKSFAQYCGIQTENDGFQWERICQGDKEGAKSMGGVTFIPLSRGYTLICYHVTGGGWFSVRKDGKSDGACDITGREIVAPGRYDDVHLYDHDAFPYYGVELNGKEGMYDINGREILPPRYDGIYCREKEGYKYIHVIVNNKEGIYDINGREIIAPRYKWVVYNEGEFKINETGDGWKPTGIKLSSLVQTPAAAPTPTPSPTPTPTPTPTPEPIRQPQPFQVWQQCQYCGGSGDCHVCLGTGRGTSGGYCIICGGRKKCSHCAGQGGHYVIEYR